MLKGLVVFALSLLVFPAQVYAQAKPNTHVDADVKVISTPAKDGYDRAAVWINLALAVIGTFGISAAFITLRKLERQTKATEDAVDVANRAHALAEKTAKQQLRAYMVLRQGKLLILDGGALRLKLEIENSGQTPAYDLQGAHRIGIYAYSSKPPLAPLSAARSKGIVGSGKAFYVIADISQTENDIESLRKNPLAIFFVNARFTYLDIFKESHHLWVQVAIGGPMGVQIDTDASGKRFYVLPTDAEGNEAD